LAQYRPVPGQAEPGQVIKDLRLPFRPRAALIEIFNPKQKHAALAAGEVMSRNG
jgi:hypothetical protein